MPTYIIRAGDNGPVKIGRADDVGVRLATLQTAHAETLHLLRVVDTPFEAEAEFHEHFAEHHIRGEWFRFHPEMLTYIPTRAVPEAPVLDIVDRARREARQEVSALIEEIYRSYRDWNTRREFSKRLAALLGIKKSRAFNLMAKRSRVIEVHELVGLRALARKLTTPDEAVERARAATERANDLPLLKRLNDKGESK